MKYILIILLFACSKKDYNPEAKPANKKVQETVKKLQGFGEKETN